MVRTIRALDKPRVSDSVETATSGTSLGSVFWINQDNINSNPLCFVCDELPQLVETPITEPSVHSFSFSLFPDTFQIFHHDGISTIESGDNLFADSMIFNSHKSFLFSRDMLEQSSGTSSAFGLKLFSQSRIFTFDSFSYGRMEELPIGSDEQFINAEVQTKNTSLRLSATGLNFFSKCENEETPIFFIKSEETFAHIPTIKIFFKTFRNIDIKRLSSLDSGDAQDIMFERGTSRKVVSDRTPVDDWLGFSLFDYSTGLFYTGYSKLAMETDFPEMLIDEWMESDIIPNFFIPSDVNTIIQPFFIEGYSFDYFRSCLDFDFSCGTKSHHNLYNFEVIYKFKRGEAKFIP